MKDLFGDKIERAVDLLKMYQPKDRPYYGCFSGGKDSCVIKEIARLGNINVIWNYNVTTIDPPELTRFIKKFHSDVVWHVPEENFFDVARRMGFPTRKNRWCCEVFKETRTPIGEVMIFGVRADESPRRAKQWKEVSAHTRTQAYVISPIIDWTDSEVWQFVKSRAIPYCQLYDQGMKRIGCIGCPMSRHVKEELQRWPHFEKRWRNLFHQIWELRSGCPDRRKRVWFGDKYFRSADEMFNWWITGEAYPQNDDCQGLLDFYS